MSRELKVLLDILHPAHVHFFRHSIETLLQAEHRVTVTARDKDITLELLERYGIPFRCLSREARTKVGLLGELLSRNGKMFRLVREERPNVLASIGGISTAQVGLLTGTRNVIFYDTENATLSNLASYPLASEVITPDCYRRRVCGRHVTYAGYHELAYLHESRFTPDRTVLLESGIDPGEPYSVVRFVSWRAVHDVMAQGFSTEQRIGLVKTLEKFGRVFLTSESPLPGELEPYRLRLAPEKVHQLLAFARLFVGESATMASESVVLGTPAVYVDAVGRGYTDEQERRFGLCFNYRPDEAAAATSKAAEILSRDLKHDPAFRASVRRMLSGKIDVTRHIVEKLVGRAD